MADFTYNHYCPHQPTIADLQGLLLAAWELAQAAAKVAAPPIAGELQGVIVTLRQRIEDLALRDPAAAPTGLLEVDYCEPVRTAWSLASKVALAAPGVLDEALAQFGQANEIARSSMRQSPPTSGRGVPVVVQVLGLLVLGGGVVGMFAWLALRPQRTPRRALEPGLRGPKRPTPLTSTNLYALFDLFGDRSAPKGVQSVARTKVPNRVAPVDAPHIRRAIQRGIVTVEKNELALDPTVAALLWSSVPVWRPEQTEEYKAARSVLDDYLAHKVA